MGFIFNKIIYVIKRNKKEMQNQIWSQHGMTLII